MGRPEILSEPLGGSALSVAARAGKLPDWYAPLPRDARGWREYAREIAGSVDAGWLETLAPAIQARGAAAERLERTANGRGLVVTTGQQPGLFGGPLMTLNKAITARALADVLTDVLDVPVAPVFWAATDDADFDEAAVVSVALDGGARALRLSQRPTAGTPMALAALDASAGQLADALKAACGSAPHARFLDATLDAYHPNAGATIGGAYVALLRTLLEPLEISVLDVSHAAAAAAGRPLLARAAHRAAQVAAAVAARSDAIRSAGFEPQVEEVAGLSLVSASEAGIKRRLPISEATRFDASSRPNESVVLSSTVLLRPVLERAILPTATYVGGPGEVAYFAQVSAVAEALGVPVPRVAGRWSATIVEPRIRRILDALDLSVGDFADPHAPEGLVARRRLAPGVQAAIESLRADVARDIAALRAADGDLLPARALEGARRGLEHRIERLERRLVAGAKRRETTLMRDVATARGALFPHGARQERRLSFVPFLARYGPSLIEDMIAAARQHAHELIGGVRDVAQPPVASPARL